MRILTIRTPESLADRLSAVARRRGESKSALARAALEAYLANESEPVPGSCLDLARDLVGRFEGPIDLSSNAKHLEGFGQSGL